MGTVQYFSERRREQLKNEIAWIVANKVNDPRIPSITSITGVKLAQDQRNALVFVSVFGDEKVRKGALIALEKAAPFIQRGVGQRMKMKNTPKLMFRIDDSLDRGDRIEELLKQVEDDLG